MKKLFTLLLAVMCLITIKYGAYGQPISCTPTQTGENATIAIPINAQLTLDGNPLPLGSHIIAMFNNNGVLTCGGYATWNGTATAMIVYGAEGGNPGFAVGEVYKFWIEKPGGCIVANATATYVTGGIYTNTNTYAHDGLSGIATLQATSMKIDAIGQNPLCNGGTNGTGSVAFTTSGITPYQYAWSNGQTTATATGLSVGSYSVTVTDATGCTATDGFTLQQPTAISVTTTTTPATGGASNGSATAIASGGTPSYTYKWSTTPTINSATANGLAAGTYTVTVTDSQGCTKTGTATVTSSGGSGACLDWVAPSPTTGWNNFNSAFGGAPCNDGTGCPFYEISDFSVWASEAYEIDGFIQGGTYAFSMCNGTGAGSWIPDFTIIAPNGNVDKSGLGDGDGCTITWTASQSGTYLIVINEAGHCGGGSNLSTDNGWPAITCISNANCILPCANSTLAISSVVGNSNGTATVTASGGVLPYSYLWSNGQTTQTTMGVPTGNYSVTVTDANGCTVQGTVSVISSSQQIENLLSLVISPNPSSGRFLVDMRLGKTENVQVDIYDVTGVHIISEKQFSPSPTFSLDLTDRPSGLYLLKATIGDAFVTRNLIVTK